MQAFRLRLAHTFINRDFALFMGGSFISAMGMWFRTVTVSWVAFEMTGSAFYLGMLTFAQLAPILFFGLLGGVLADRVDRRRLMLTVSTVVTLFNTLLAALGAGGWINPAILLALVATLGLCDAVMFPTWQAVIKDLVPTERLRTAVAVSSVRFNLSRVLAPALAGGLLSIAGPAACLAVSAGSSLGIILVTLAIRPRKLTTSRPVSWWAAIGQGLDYTRREVDVRRLLLVTAGFGLLVLPHQAFLPAYTERQLGLGPEGLGTLLTAVGVGGIVGALITGSRYTNNREYRAMGAFTIVTGLGLLILGFIPTLAAALLGLAMVGVGSIGFWTASQSTIQLIVPDRLVGRVMSVYVALSAGAMPLGSLALGSVAEQGGTRIVMVIGGVSALLLCLPLLLRRPPPERG